MTNFALTISVLDVSRMNHDGQQQSYRVHGDVTLAIPSPSYQHHSHEAPFFRGPLSLQTGYL